MKQWADLCRAVGIPIAELSPFEIYLAGGGIVHSTTLRPYLLPYVGIDPKQPTTLPEGTRLKVLYSGKVTQEDMAKIRQEACAAIPAKLKGK